MTPHDVYYCTEAAPYFLIAFAQRRDPQGARESPGPTEWQAGALTIERRLTPIELRLTPIPNN